MGGISAWADGWADTTIVLGQLRQDLFVPFLRSSTKYLMVEIFWYSSISKHVRDNDFCHPTSRLGKKCRLITVLEKQL